MKKIKLTGIILILCLLMPQTAAAAIEYCRYPYGSSEATGNCSTTCEYGYKTNGMYNSNTLACIDPQCVSAQTGKTKCDKCNTGFFVKGNLCEICLPGATCDGITAVCAAGQYFNGSSCSACNSACATCSGSSGSSCLSCKEGYSRRPYSDGTLSCAPCETGCKSCSDFNKHNCTACYSGKYLSNGQCLACPANGTCDGSPAVLCRSGYVFSNGACEKEQAAPTATVSSCPSRMTLSSDGCCCINKQ